MQQWRGFVLLPIAKLTVLSYKYFVGPLDSTDVLAIFAGFEVMFILMVHLRFSYAGNRCGRTNSAEDEVN